MHAASENVSTMRPGALPHLDRLDDTAQREFFRVELRRIVVDNWGSADRQVYKEPTHLAAVDLTAQHDFAVAIHAVQLKNVLCQINPNRCNIHSGRSHPQ
jgi:hypothetical protein